MNEDVLRRRDDWLKRVTKEGKLRNPTEDHKVGLLAMQSTIRREIFRFIGDGKRLDEIKERFNLGAIEANLHLGLLEQALFIECVEEGEIRQYIFTPRGEEYLKNVELRKPSAELNAKEVAEKGINKESNRRS